MADIALVCGAGGALGSALVEAFAARGDTVVAVERRLPEQRGDGTIRDGVLHRAADLTDSAQVDALWGSLVADGLRPRWVVNAAGGFRPGTVAASTPDDVAFLAQLNLGTAWWSCRAAAAGLPEGGAVLNIGSRSGVSGGTGAAAYAVAKAAVVRLTEVLAAELRPRRIRANALLPAVIDTPANRTVLGDDELRVAVAPAAIAAVAAFLLSDAAAVVTGAVLPVYGWA